ncbi:MAG: hypothetical protein EOM12_04025 [Verrucomicrobiae bacterium]|nr:hypothetical protein [Verrucomicrobiae bacterium]
MKKNEETHLNAPIRFLRSADLERDFYDASVFQSYVLTDAATTAIRRIAEGLSSESGQRAWRIIGDYGSGKSSFALLLAHWISGSCSAFPKQLKTSLNYREFGISKPSLVPVLAKGSREPLGVTIQRAIQNAADNVYPDGLGRGSNKLNTLLKKDVLQEKEVLDLIHLFRDCVIKDKKGTGILLVVDEMGKSLEFAASAPEETDVFLLQRLAEDASRSKDKPFFIVGILHQGFSSYASMLGLTAQKEWDKVAGRYEEIVYQHPMAQTLAIVAEALKDLPKKIAVQTRKRIKKAMNEAVKARWYGSGAKIDDFEHFAEAIYPLDPFVLPVMSRILHRFGQNQRSVFSFLFGNEPFSLKNHLYGSKNDKTYGLNDLYDYIHANIGHYLASMSHCSHWTIIDSVMRGYTTLDPMEVDILKTVGVLNLLDANDLLCTKETISLCMTGTKNSAQILSLLEKLMSETGKRVIYDRGPAGGLCLWPYLSVDLEDAYEKVSKSIPPIMNPCDYVKKHLHGMHLIARKHYITTGTLRYFKVVFCDLEELQNLGLMNNEEADGLVVVPLCLDKNQIQSAISIVESYDKSDERLERYLVAIPKPLQQLVPLIREFRIWEMIGTSTPELNGDRYARETVSRKKEQAEMALEQCVQDVIGLNNLSGKISLTYFWKGEKLDIEVGSDLLRKLSEICDDVYKKAPLINNELVNRRNLSSAAASARMRLIENILESPEKSCLGMDETKKPPEMAIYLSLLKNGGLHIQNGENWHLSIPTETADDPLQIQHIYRALDSHLQSTSDKCHSVSSLFSLMRNAPFGIRAGVAPILLAIYYTVHKKHIAFYQNGSFLSEVTGPEFLRMTKKPNEYELQYCNVDGVRATTFSKLAQVLNVEVTSPSDPDLLDVVRPLCVFAARQPDYVKATNTLSSEAQVILRELLEARMPVDLLFSALPKACGCKPLNSKKADEKNAEEYVETLQRCIAEISSCYDDLRDRIGRSLVEKFGVPKSNREYRADIGTRAERLSRFIADPKLKAFCFRLQDTVLDEDDWLASVASLVVSRPPDKWRDRDEHLFNENLHELVAQFLRTESVAFDRKGNAVTDALRLSVTMADGTEKKQVLAMNAKDEKKVASLQKQFEKLIKEHGDVALLAASKAVWKNLRG